ncbi:MAG: DNA-directed RNA polymerase subunit omega [Actinomycetota bacterium]|nr:DNA-directed RNA polymerase subunit omega [Actinomycetota bacterium]
MIAITRIDDLIDKVDSRFTLVHLAAKRAREINDYYAQLGEGLGQHVPPLVSTESNKPLSIALQEIAEAKVEPRWPDEQAVVEDPLAFIDEDVSDEDVAGGDVGGEDVPGEDSQA